MAFDVSLPPEGILAKQLNNDCRQNFTALLSTIAFGHDFNDGAGTQTGEHNEGSAVIYSGAVAPTNKEDGSTALDAGDQHRRLWFDTGNDILKVYTDTPGWENIIGYVGMLDEDNMVSDSDTLPATQQSIKAYVDTAEALLLLLDGTRAMTGALNMGTNKVQAVGTPAVATDAATMGYVDGLLTNMANIKVGTYSGTAPASQQVSLGTAAGCKFVLIKNIAAGGGRSPICAINAGGAMQNVNLNSNAAVTADSPIEEYSDGFQVGNDNDVNENGIAHYYVAFF